MYGMIILNLAEKITGCTKLVSIRNLNDETKWETLEEKRKKHKLTLFYKMTHNLTPSFLSSLVPQPVHAASSYNLRNSNYIQNIPARSNYYHNSFLPSTVRELNNLPYEPVHAKRYKLVKIFKICFFAENVRKIS